MVLLHLGGSLFGLIFSIPELWNLLIGTIHLFPSSLLKLSDRLLNTLFCHFAFGHTLSQDIQLFSGNFEFFFSDRLMRSLSPCLPLDCSQMRAGRTAVRDPHPGGFVSARDTLGWISSVNCSVAVSTCPWLRLKQGLLSTWSWF